MFGPIFATAEANTFGGAQGTGDCPAAPSGYVCVVISDPT